MTLMLLTIFFMLVNMISMLVNTKVVLMSLTMKFICSKPMQVNLLLRCVHSIAMRRAIARDLAALSP